MKEILIGTLKLGDTVDITDPCYDKGTWCRMTKSCKPGTYTGYGILHEDGCVRELYITKKDRCPNYRNMRHIGVIGVDAGLAGFFNNKPDYNNEEWQKFCDSINHNEEFHIVSYGIFSHSGWGDGCYDVYVGEDNDEFGIIFISDEDCDETEGC